jgi:glycosyltransferase involved in cell wall biosynthesis
MTTIHQVVPVLAPRDAVGNHTLALRDALRDAGYDSDVFAEVRVGAHQHVGRELAELDSVGAADLLLFQASTGSGAADWVLARPEPLAVNYHNITPARFFEPWDAEAAASMRRARNQLSAMARRSTLALADSPYNAAELTEVGYHPVVVAPLLLDLESRLSEPDPRTLEHLARTRRGTHWLFVGRVAPNKAQHDLVAAFAAYRALYDPGARLTLVGGPAAASYWDAVLALVDALDLQQAVTLAGGVTDAELSAYYDDADVFVCLSRHEGFGVPLLEAMRHDLPVVALAQAAVPDTVGPAALLLDDHDPHLVAAAVAELLDDAAFCARLVTAGRSQVAAHSLDAARTAWLDLLGRHLAGEALG